MTTDHADRYDLEPRSGESPLVVRRLHAFVGLLEQGVDVDSAAEQVAKHPEYGLRSWADGSNAPTHPSRLAGQLLLRVAPKALEEGRAVATTLLATHTESTVRTLLGLISTQAADKDDAAGRRVQLDACRLALECVGLGRGARQVSIDARQVHVHNAEHEQALDHAQQLLEAIR